MTVRPPTLERPTEAEGPTSPEVLFREARRRRRRRWVRGLAVLVVATVGTAIGYGAVGHGGPVRTRKASAPARNGQALQQSSRSAGASSTSFSLLKLDLVTPSVGYGLFQRWIPGDSCTRAVAETTDGGLTFGRLVALPCNVFDVAFNAHGDGFAYGTILEVTHDGGRTWTPDTQWDTANWASWHRSHPRTIGITPGRVTSLQIVGKTVWMLEQRCTTPTPAKTYCTDQLWKSPNLGREWSLTSAQPFPGRLDGVPQGALVGTSADDAYVLGAAPDAELALRSQTTTGATPLAYTDDGGATWALREVTCGTENDNGPTEVRIAAAPGGMLFAACGFRSTGGSGGLERVLISTDNGMNWSFRGVSTNGFLPGTPYLSVLVAVSRSTAYMFSTPDLMKTTDGGRKWSRIVHITTVGGLFTGAFVSERNGEVTFLTSSGTTHFMATVNGGKTWRRVEPKKGAAPPLSVTSSCLDAQSCT